MNAYELMIKTNHHIIKGGELTAAQKANIVRQFMAARSDERTKLSFYKGVRYPYNVDSNGSGQMYPEYFIPPYNDGKKLQTVIPISPKTHILSANSYELEIIRLLYLFTPEDAIVNEMVNVTLKRLKTTCFGNGCAQGECFHTALFVLRFLAVAAPNEIVWINHLITFFNEHIEDKLHNKHIHSNTVRYFWLCLSELPYAIAEAQLTKYENEYFTLLQKRSSILKNETDKIYHTVLYCVLRNCLSRFPEYEYLKYRQPYLSEKDGRLCFDVNLTL